MEDKKKNETRQSTMQNRMEDMNGQKPKTISIVISVYNEEKALHEFYREATPVFEALPWNYELIFVNDGSADASGQILAELAAADPRVRVINFSRNLAMRRRCCRAGPQQRGGHRVYGCRSAASAGMCGADNRKNSKRAMRLSTWSGRKINRLDSSKNPDVFCFL